MTYCIIISSFINDNSCSKRISKIPWLLQLESYPMCMWTNQEQLWVGDRAGQLNLIDTTDGDFDLVQVTKYVDYYEKKRS